MKKQEIGIIGLGVMGQNLAMNMERNGFSVAGYDLDQSRTKQVAEKVAGKDIAIAATLDEFLNSLKSPRRIMLMVPAGAPVDSVIEQLRPHLSKGDVLIDGGNSFFKDTERRGQSLEADHIHYIGTGVSGGEEGALWGPAIMPGGPKNAYRLVKPILTKISAHVGSHSCCTYIGPGAAGHFVKMVHNGIEYGDMQTICEAYDILKNCLHLSPAELQQTFTKWNQGQLNSYLMEITANILGKIDDETGKPLVDVILDKAGQKGTGKWTAQTALDLGVAAPTLAMAVEARILSAFKNERLEAAKILGGPQKAFKGSKDYFIRMVHDALLMSKIACYAQGFAIMREASREYSWNLKFHEIAQIWRGGCIIRAKLLEQIRRVYKREPDLTNLMVAPYFSRLLNKLHKSVRYVVRTAAGMGVPALAFSTSLSYYDSYRREVLPANLLQAQRDYFGAHTYNRVDKEGVFHTEWTK
ncbi:NADP-dependent phosphogluconate dehydrogenase [candidate division KSB1 bacterium]|nr:NADP-dependent phosphogluconate dehydrogenase [candidate division KSB1 bacterium]